MKRAQLLTLWTGSGISMADARRPQIAQDFTLFKCTDMTGQPAANLIPSPNLYVVEIVCEDAVMAAIEASAEYGDGVLWVEDV